MERREKSKIERLVEKLDRELVARNARIFEENGFQFTDKEGTPQREIVMERVKELYRNPPPLNKALSRFCTGKLEKLLELNICKLRRERGIWNSDTRKDVYEIEEEPVKENTRSVAAICTKNDLLHENNGFASLRVKNYGKAFNLCDCEKFHLQPAASGPMCSGFLVKKDVVATAGHCIDYLMKFSDKKDVTDFRFVFGYHMSGPSTPVTDIPLDDIYKGEEIIRRIYRRGGDQSDWALVKLDRHVEGRETVVLSGRDMSDACKKPIYIIGYPLGLPIKYSPGASVGNIGDAYFSADLNVYCGSSGSPVFDSESNEVIGIVAAGDDRDFRLAGNCWKSVIYSRAGLYAEEPQCTRVSEFINSVDQL
ncbi:MAG: trypsin-like peptidase domain-containing protein [bacterium]|nr:trypsin-like peptidase domain-containing protein [bacterium]